MMAHEEERFVLGPVLEKIDGQVGDDVRHVTFDQRRPLALITSD